MYWVAREKDGILKIFTEMPERDLDKYWVADGRTYEVPSDLYPDQKWEDEPKQVVMLPMPSIESIATNPTYHLIYDLGADEMANSIADELSIKRIPDYCKRKGCCKECGAWLCDNCNDWDFDIKNYIQHKKLIEEVIKETTHGMSNKEMRELLSQYPDDAMVAVECCDVRRMAYCKADNSIRID